MKGRNHDQNHTLLKHDDHDLAPGHPGAFLHPVARPIVRLPCTVQSDDVRPFTEGQMRHWCTLNFVATGIIFQGAGMSGNEITWVRVDDLTHYAQVGIWKLFVHKKRTDSRKWLAGVHGCRFSEVKLKSGELEEAQWEAVELFYKHLADAAKTLCPSLTAYRHAFPTMKETA